MPETALAWETMEPSSHSTSFGRYLKAIRENRNIAISSVADQLRVSVWHLSLIEAEDHGKLPDEVYVRGTLRAYAEYIGVDPADIIERYELNRKAWLQTTAAEREILSSGRYSVFRMTVALCMLAAVAVTSIILFEKYSPRELPVTVTEAPEAAGHADFVYYASEIPHEGVGSETLQADIPGNHRDGWIHLRLVALSEIRVEIHIDDGERESFRFNPKDEIRVEAKEQFRLYVSDAGGIRIYLNDHPLAMDGEPEQDVNIVVRKTPPEDETNDNAPPA